MTTDKLSGLEKALWSVALPGFGQLLNKKYCKGFLLIILEVLINMNANLNSVIILSFYGNTPQAVAQTQYQWLLFYPCIYLFAIYDAYKDGKKEESPLLFLPFVLAAYMGTIAVIYSPHLTIFGFLLGPIFLPIIVIILSLFLGSILKSFLLK